MTGQVFKMMMFAGMGGFVGSCCRFLLSRWCAGWFGGAFPVGTLVVNLLGCFLFGLIFGLLERANMLTTAENALLITGFCGGLTTFSTFASDTLTLADRNAWLPLTLYLSLSLTLGLLLLALGRAITRG